MNIDKDTDHEMLLLLTGFLSYRCLRGRRDLLGISLRSDEAARLAELERVFGGGEGAGGNDPRPLFLPRLRERQPISLRVEFRGDDDAPCEGRMSNLSTTGFVVETTSPCAIGHRVMFKFVDTEAWREWQFAGEVVRDSINTRSGMSLRFVGIPLEVRLGHPPRPTSMSAAA